MARWSPFWILLGVLSLHSETLPQFENFRVAEKWSGRNAKVKLTLPSERMFRTKLTEGALEAPDFAAHYRFVSWGCGSACAAGALVDLQTGDVYRPPGVEGTRGWDRWIFAGGVIDLPYLDIRADSRLAIVRQQGSKPGTYDVSYYEWTGRRFRLLRQRLNVEPDSGGNAPE